MLFVRREKKGKAGAPAGLCEREKNRETVRLEDEEEEDKKAAARRKLPIRADGEGPDGRGRVVRS